MNETKTKAPPAFQFYPQDFLVGTADMSADEVGGYIRLLCYQWTKNGVPCEDKKLLQLAGVATESLPAIKAKFTIVKSVDGVDKLFNERLDNKLAEVQQYREEQKQRAEKRWDKEKKIKVEAPEVDKEKIVRDAYNEIKKGQTGVLTSKFISDHKPIFAEPYIELWNFFAAKNSGVAKVSTISSGRRKKVSARLKEKAFDFPAILTAASKQQFALGSKWFTFDWLIENDTNYVKVLENKYTTQQKVEAGLPTVKYENE